MRAAILLSQQHMERGEGGPFGAVVVRGEEIIGRGWNKVTSTQDPTAHSEVVAIRAACRKLGTFRLDDCEIYTSCEPCPMCLAAIYWARLRQVWFGNTRQDAAHIGFDDDFLYRQVALPLARRTLPMQQLLPAEAAVVFRAWAAKPDKVPY